jgi:23S rRNA pseudoU1915 N3-methylase RlmH
MANEWLDFVAKWRKANPNVKSYAEALKQAGAEYKKKKGTKGAVNVSRVKAEKKRGEADTKDFTTKKGDKLKTGKRKGEKAFAMDKN